MNMSDRPPSVSFIVPALNEEGRICATVDTILGAMNEVPDRPFEIVLVNDGSTDKTAMLMDELVLRRSEIRVVHNERNLGFGGAFQRGLAVAKNDYVMVVAGDNAASRESIVQTVRHLGEADILIPRIANPEIRSRARRIGSRAYTLLLNFLFNLRVGYYNGMIPKRELLQQLTLTTSSNAVHAEALVKLLKAGCTYKEVAIHHQPALDYRSAALKPRNLLKVFKAIIHLYREVHRPGAIPQLRRLETATTSEKP